jgi:hypothetical protein
MKSSIVLSVFSAVSAAAAIIRAHPTWPSNFHNISRNIEVLKRGPVCSREADNVISDIANAEASGQSVQVYTAGASGGALSVCVLLSNHGIGSIADCAPIAGIVAAGTAVIYTAVQNKATGTTTAGKRDESSLAAVLTAQFEFESISAMPYTKRAVRVNDTSNSTRYMDNRFSIKALKHSGHLSDLILTTYTDGTGHIFTQPTPINTTSLSKRHDGPGFKINFRTIKFANGLGGAPSFPSLNADLAGGIAQDWAARANTDNIDEYFCTTGITNPKLETIGLRIISENNGFGEEYESVDICGNLGSSHDEL